MEKHKTETDVTYWHPAFYADIRIELAEEAEHLIFENEHQLGTNPMEIDVLIIKKEKGRKIKKNIGKIFRTYNILEYKSPDDFLSIDDFYKVYGYTCFYKADTPLTDSISIQELTITFISEKYPRKLIGHLEKVKKYTVKNTEAGIYLVCGDLIPIQIIVTKKLSAQKNLWLKSLTNKLYETEKARTLMADYVRHSHNNLYRSVLETIIRANPKTFEEVNEMGDIFMEICHEKFERKLKEAVEIQVEERVKEELEERVKEELEGRVKEELEGRVKEELEGRVKEELEGRVKEELEGRVKEELEERVKEELEERSRMERILLIRKKCRKKKPLAVIEEEMEAEPGSLQLLYDIVCKNTEKPVEELYRLAVCEKVW